MALQYNNAGVEQTRHQKDRRGRLSEIKHQSTLNTHSRAAGNHSLAQARVGLELGMQLLYHGRRVVVVVIPPVRLAIDLVVHPVLPNLR